VALTVGELVAVLGVDDRDFHNKMDSAGKKFSNFGSTLAKGAIATAAVGGIAMVGLAAGLFKAGTMAAEDAAIYSRFHTVLGNVVKLTKDQTKAVDDYIAKAQLRYGVDEGLLLPAFQNLVVATKNVGEAQGVMAIAMDVSQAKGLDLEAVTKALAKAHDGNVGALGRLGVQTKDTEGKVLTYEQILKNLSATYEGSAAAAADTYEGKVARVKLGFGELVESIGYKVLPIMETLIGWVNDNMPTIQLVFDTVFAAIGKAIDWVTTNVVPFVVAAFQSVKDWVTSTEGEGTLTRLWDFVKLTFDNLWAAIKYAWEEIIKPAWDALSSWISSAEGQKTLTTLWETLQTVFTGVGDVVKFVWEKVVKPFWIAMKDWIVENQDTLKKVWTDLKSIFEDLIIVAEPIWKKIKQAIEAVPWGTVVGVIMTPFKALASLIGGIKTVMEWITGNSGGTVPDELKNNAYDPWGRGVQSPAPTSPQPRGLDKQGMETEWGPGLAKTTDYYTGIKSKVDAQKQSMIDAKNAVGFGGLTPVAERLWNLVAGMFPASVWMGGYNKRYIAGTTTWSDHAFGKAFDVGSGSSMPDSTKYSISRFLAGALGSTVKYLIYNHEINSGRGWRPYGGQNPHHDHVHVSTYLRGGAIPGSGPVPIMAHGGEYVLTKGDTGLMQKLIASVNAGGSNAELVAEMRAMRLEFRRETDRRVMLARTGALA
jgi:hypothetical protein